MVTKKDFTQLTEDQSMQILKQKRFVCLLQLDQQLQTAPMCMCAISAAKLQGALQPCLAEHKPARDQNIWNEIMLKKRQQPWTLYYHLKYSHHQAAR